MVKLSALEIKSPIFRVCQGNMVIRINIYFRKCPTSDCVTEEDVEHDLCTIISRLFIYRKK
jgi:hypothetical protein